MNREIITGTIISIVFAWQIMTTYDAVNSAIDQLKEKSCYEQFLTAEISIVIIILSMILIALGIVLIDIGIDEIRRSKKNK